MTAAHHFFLKALPLREPDSMAALATFLATVERSTLPSPDVDAVLLRCLSVLDKYNQRRIPSLVDQYLAAASAPNAALAHFTSCVASLLRHRGIQHGGVQQALEIVHRRIADSSLTPRSIADEVGIQLSTLDVAFKRQMNCTLTEYVREVRLDRAVVLLATTGNSIKEVWTEVGYNHPSNFNHDFKRRFGLSPSDLRARAIRPFAQLRYPAMPSRDTSAPGPAADDNGMHIMIVDNDECTTNHVGGFLRHHGYTVSIARTGGEALVAARQHPPDTILVDYHLEDMDGLAFVRTVREAHGAEPAVALFTADWDLFERADEVHALNAVIASKLCDLDQVKDLVTTLSTPCVASGVTGAASANYSKRSPTIQR